MFKSLNHFFIAIGIVATAMAGCAQQPEQEAGGEAQIQETSASDMNQLVAVIHPTEGNKAMGTVTFQEAADGVRVHAEVEGLEEGKHGFHIHQYGDCTASDGTSAGGHYNPENKQHGAPADEERHVGDMGNIEANAQGQATLDYVDDTIQLTGPNGILGRGIVIHGGEDDLSSQPTGAAGPRLACGVIGVANPE